MMKEMIAILIISVVLYSGCQGGISPMTFQPDPTPTPNVPTKQVVTTSLPFIEKWRWSGRVFTGSWYPPAVVFSNERIIIAIHDGSGKKIVVFDPQTGNSIWKSNEIRSLKSLSAKGNRIYVGTIRYAQAFDLETGKELWRGAEQPIDKKGFLYLYPVDEQLQVYDFGQNRLYLLDRQTGQTMEEITYPFIFFKKENLYYSGCGYGYKTACLRATDEMEGKALWSHDFGGFVHLWPTFIDDSIMIINAGGQLFAVAPKTGNIIWESEPHTFVTGVSVQDNVAYALRRDAAIVGLDPETGKEVGVIEMTPNRTIEDDGGYVTHYAIAVSDKFMAVYYGNSQELIVFKNVDAVGN